jgi:hypothetical protein
MYKEITTCDTCGGDATKKGCASVEVIVNQGAAPRSRRMRRRRYAGAWANLDFCAKCYSKSGLKKLVAKHIRGTGRRHRRRVR